MLAARGPMLSFEALCLSTQSVVSLGLKTLLKYVGLRLLFARFSGVFECRFCGGKGW
jgi:hypothetical protein